VSSLLEQGRGEIGIIEMISNWFSLSNWCTLWSFEVKLSDEMVLVSFIPGLMILLILLYQVEEYRLDCGFLSGKHR